MEDVVLSFVMFLVVIIDANRNFSRVFEGVLKELNINVWVLSQGNHKGDIAEKYHHFEQNES